ncbi:unnamed protein product, partial [marine sediment metagenome]
GHHATGETYVRARPQNDGATRAGGFLPVVVDTNPIAAQDIVIEHAANFNDRPHRHTATLTFNQVAQLDRGESITLAVSASAWVPLNEMGNPTEDPAAFAIANTSGHGHTIVLDGSGDFLDWGTWGFSPSRPVLTAP